MKLIHRSTAEIEICNKDLYKDIPLKGILFDMDGVVLDTEKLYTRFWVEAGQSLGFPMTHEMGLGLRSLNGKAGAKRLKTYLGESADYEKIRQIRIQRMNDYIRQNGVETKAGIEELLRFLKTHGIRTAIASSSPLERIENYLSQTGLIGYFDELVSGQMVEKGKPEPDIYYLAAKKLNLNPSECVVIEDSPTGVKAGFEAGAVPVMVPDLDRPDERTKGILYAVAEDMYAMQGLFEI